MTWRTHVVGGLSALWLLEGFSGAVTPDTLGPLALSAALGALLPDLDAQQSKIQSLGLGNVHPFVPLAGLAYHAFGHRGLLHSWAGFAGMALIALPLALWWGWAPSVGLCLGFASHLGLDACTPSGLPCSPFHRNDRRRWHLLPPSLRVVTGSPDEEIAFCLLALSTLWLLLRHLPTA